MAVRRWDAWFEKENLVVRRRRLLPWQKAHVRQIPLAAILDIASLTATDHAKRRAQLTVQDPSVPHLTEVIPVRFTPEQWEHAGWFVPARQAAPTERPQPGEEPSSGGVASPRPRVEVPAQSRRQAQPPTGLRAHPTAKRATTPAVTGRTVDASSTPSPRPVTASTTVMRAGDGKRPVWLWLQNGADPCLPRSRRLRLAAQAEPRRCRPLLLADPSRAMPAIRALTGVAEGQQALARLRSWQRSDRVVVNLSASGLAGRRVTEALQKPGRSNPDGTVQTVSGGLPSLNKRRR
ncbi:hypothetical protein GCM10023176_05120 [Micromonospora coerulea]|uniref:Uncharacterized protein n=1 Tax=Micromonospora coerulea TaxID=47856 RepID=A0ABP8S7Z8_9ACTN